MTKTKYDTSTSVVLKRWAKEQRAILETSYPTMDKKTIKVFVDKMIERHLINPSGKMINNYLNLNMEVDLLHICNWLEDTKPIIGGFGVFFMNQNQATNPVAQMLINFLDLRSKFKKLLKVYLESSYEYSTANRKQMTEKVNANSIYGVGGSKTSLFYNVFTASSVTATAQSLISTTEQAFEMFLGNSVLFIDIDECFNFIRHIQKEKRHIDGRVLPNVSVELLIDRLKEMFETYKESYDSILFNYLIHLDQDDLNRIYFKNNFYQFSYLPFVRSRLIHVLENTSNFRDPAELPETSDEDIRMLWDLYHEFVFYNHFTFGRIDRLRHDKRKVVVVVDTDSNMLNVHPWVEFVDEYLVPESAVLQEKQQVSDDEFYFIKINLISFFIGEVVNTVLLKYTKTSNVLKEYRWRINMKNEYLFSRLILSDVKKRYISNILLKEGKEVEKSKSLDIKGHDFIKSGTRPETRDFFIDMIKRHVLTDDIRITDILDELEEFERGIQTSLRAGEKNFLIPNSVKEPEAYDDPYKMQQFRAVIAWNTAYPDQAIQLPAKVDLVRVNMERLDDIIGLKSVEPEIYNQLVERIYNSSIKKLAEKGIIAIAIPQNVDRVPDWIVPFINVSKITSDNVSRFGSVLQALGVKSLKTKDKKFFSNILDI